MNNKNNDQFNNNNNNNDNENQQHPLLKNKKLLSLISSIVVIIALIIVGDYSGAMDSFMELISSSEQTQTSQTGTAVVSDDNSLEVHFIDVGQADAIVIRQDEHTMLVDAGENETGEEVVEYIKSLGITEFDYAVGTHPHSDHIGAMRKIINNFDIEEVFIPAVEHDTYTYEKTLSLIEEKGITLTIPEPMDTIEFGDAKITFISPASSMEFDDMNDYSITFILEFEDFSAMFTGDMGVAAEKIILEKGYDIDCDVLKIAHHGSKTASSNDFIDAVTPEYGIMTVALNHDSNLPAKTIVKRCEEKGVKLYRTDYDGNIVLTTDGENIEFETEKK